MSRVGKMPVPVPAGVDITIKGAYVKVKGAKGEMEFVFSPAMTFKREGAEIIIERASEEPDVRALHGTTRAVLNNMVVGVSRGFEKVLEINGVGYRAEMNGKNLVLHLGYSHPIVIEPRPGISFETEARTRQVKVMGYDKQAVGQIASEIRKLRPPEPYLGKGIRYIDETIRRKVGKSGK